MRPAPWRIREAREAFQVRRRAGLDMDDLLAAVQSFAPRFRVVSARGNPAHAAHFRPSTHPAVRALAPQHLTGRRTVLRGEPSDTPAGQRTVIRTR